MDLKAKRPALEIAAELTAAWCLGAATAFALVRLSPLGAVAAGAIGIGAAAIAWLLMSKVDAEAGLGTPAFEPVDWSADAAEEAEEQEEEEVLLLEEPVARGADSSRVVRLFGAAPDEGAAAAAVLAAPGEMVARIEDFLGSGGGLPRASAVAAESAPPANSASDEASAALHSALADIRRSLRRG